MIAKLEEYEKKHRTFNVPRNNDELGNWVNRMQSERGDNAHPDVIAKLKAIERIKYHILGTAVRHAGQPGANWPHFPPARPRPCARVSHGIFVSVRFNWVQVVQNDPRL